jgi:iron complex outermembrane receptor protein
MKKKKKNNNNNQNNRSLFRNRLFPKLCFGVVTAATVSGASLAADQTDTTQRRTSGVIQEILITSQKQAEGVLVQDVPSAITAFDNASLENSFSVDLTDVGKMVPNVILNSVGTFAGYPNFFIRGVGVNGSTRSLDPAVGIFVDGIYLGYPASSLQSTFDRASVEVLRGPQGTLLGRNVTGGGVNVQSNRPTGEFGLKAEAKLGDYDLRELALSVDFPIVEDKVAAKIAVITASRDGYYQDNNGGSVDLEINPAGMPATSKSTKTDVDYQIIRPMIKFTPTEELDITVMGEYARNKGGTASSQNIVNPTAPKLAQTLFGYTPPSDKYEINHDLKGGTDATTKQLIVEANWDIGHGVLTSVTGYRDVKYNTSTDFDGTPFPIFAFPDNEEEQDQISQEFRYASTFSDKYNFVAGLYYFDQEFTIRERRHIMTTTKVASRTEVDHSNISAFGETNIFLDDNWTLTAGLRYTKEEKAVKFSPPGTCEYTSYSSCSVVLEDDEDWSNVSPKLAIKYAFNDDVMMYGSFTQGFRSGSYNARATRLESLGPADEETVTSYEVGLKSILFDDRIKFNMAIYLMDYEDIQQFVNNPDPEFGSEALLFNAADATISGFEAELVADLFEGFTLEANVGLVDAGYDSFDSFDTDLNGVIEPIDSQLAEDLEFVKVPKWMSHIAANYETQPGDIGTLLFRASYSWSDSYYTDVRNDPFLEQQSFGMLDASVSYINQEGNIKVSLFGKNLQDEEYFDYAANVATLDSARWGGTPRTYGVRLTYEY